MAFRKGQSGNPTGRPKGIANKGTVAAREAFQNAFDKVGGWERLASWADAIYNEFAKLYARLVPAESHISGMDGGAIQITNLDDEQVNARFTELMADPVLMKSITTKEKK